MDRVDYQLLVVQDLINLHSREELNLHPWYQRRSVWTRPAKAYLINTLFENKPVPSLYFRHSLDLEKEKSIKEVVDGQQRIISILEYSEGQFAARHPKHKHRVKYDQLSSAEKERFRMTAVSVGFLISADDSDVIEIFGRLNSVSKNLNAQEKRNARFSGEFKQFCLLEASRRVRLWRDFNIFTATQIARMAEVQFVSDVVFNMLSGLSDFTPRRIDQVYREFDESFEQREQIESRMDAAFSKLASIDVRAIHDTVFSRSPLFFTLFIVLDSMKSKVKESQLERAVYTIDEKFNSDTPPLRRPKKDAEFYVACASGTQRIKSRRIRDAYVRAHL